MSGLSPESPCESALTRGTRQSSPAKDWALVISPESLEEPHKPPAGPVRSLVPWSTPGEGGAQKPAGGSPATLADQAGGWVLMASDFCCWQGELQYATANRRSCIPKRTSFI